MVDIDGWHVCDLIVPIFFNDNMEPHNLIPKILILPYLTGFFHPSFIEEYTDGLLMGLQQQDGGIHPILCEEIWRRYFTSLTVNVTPVHNETSTFFSSTYDNLIQTSGIRDGVSYDVKILSVLYDSLDTSDPNLDTSDPNDPEVIIKFDISNVFNTNTTCRPLTLLVVSSVLPVVDDILPSSSTWTDETDGTAEIITHLILVRFTSNFVHLSPLPRLAECVSRFGITWIFPP